MRFTLILKLWIISVFLILGGLSPGHAQSDIPIGTWRMHNSYYSIKSVSIGNGVVYGAGDNGVMLFDSQDQSTQTFNKLDGLSGAGISAMAFDTQRSQLLIAYSDGNLDIIQDQQVTNFDRLKNSTTITGSKRLNSISIQGDLAYLAADYGLVVFDLEKLEVKETWRDLGVAGAMMKIMQSTFLGDSMFLATEKGVMAGYLGDNLLDFANWKRFDQGEFSGAIQSIVTFNNSVYAAINNSGIHRYENGIWTKESFLQGLNFQSLSVASANFYVSENTNLWKINSSNELTSVTDEQIVQPFMAAEDSNGNLWIGDGRNGLVSNASGSFQSFIPNGPSTSTTTRLKYVSNKFVASQGGPSSSYQPLRNSGDINSYQDGIWTTTTTALQDVVDVEELNQKTFRASFGYGVEVIDASGNATLYDESNSPLKNLNAPGRFVNITAIEPSEDGLWVANYGTSTSLHVLKSDNTWETFSFLPTASRYPTDMRVDKYGSVWMVLNPSQGGGIMVFNRAENTSAYISDATNAGGLPSKSVRSIAVDRDGYVWVGTDVGVAYFPDPSDVFTPGFNAVKPIYENRFLLRDDRVTAIAVDGGNRKWMGTERGVWLFGPDGETLIYNFTVENSPLLSNVIRAIEVDPRSGEVFFATDKGLVSFRAEATAGGNTFQSVKIFPNPVTPDFTGVVGISGLATDATVKITDISGKLIWQSQANGGTATWNLQDYTGRKARTGIYLVFAATSDGAESVVGKIAVVE